MSNDLDALEGRVDDLEDSIGGSPEIFTRTLVDDPGTPDRLIVNDFREFVALHPFHTPRWLYISATTSGVDRKTELCIFDNRDLLSYFDSTLDHGAGTDLTTDDLVYYRLNYAAWSEPNNNTFTSGRLFPYQATNPDPAIGLVLDNVYIIISSPTVYIQLVHQLSSDLYDSSHQGGVWTLVANQPTTITTIIGPSRSLTCGF